MCGRRRGTEDHVEFAGWALALFQRDPGRRRATRRFSAWIVAQAAHSVEEYIFRMYDVLLPARVISGLISSNLALGFAMGNVTLVGFGFWCYFARVRRGYPSWRTWAWSWTILEAADGTGHLLFAMERGDYFPGAATAPLLLGFAVWLGVTLMDVPPAAPRQGGRYVQ
jgi:uncharacterized protein with HXXEE motif